MMMPKNLLSLPLNNLRQFVVYTYIITVFQIREKSDKRQIKSLLCLSLFYFVCDFLLVVSVKNNLTSIVLYQGNYMEDTISSENTPVLEMSTLRLIFY